MEWPPWSAGGYYPSEDPESVPEDTRTVYACPGCMGALDIENVARVELYMGKIRIAHQCPDTGWRVTRYPKSHAALRNLFSGDYVLPWSSLNTVSHENGETALAAPEPPLQTRENQIDALVSRWSWELDGVNDAHDLLLKMRGPRSTDAQVAARHRRRRLHREAPGLLPPDAEA